MEEAVAILGVSFAKMHPPCEQIQGENLGDRDCLSDSFLDHVSEKRTHFRAGSTTVSKNSHGRMSPCRLPHVLCRSMEICLLIWSRNWPPLKVRSEMNGACMRSQTE